MRPTVDCEDCWVLEQISDEPTVEFSDETTVAQGTVHKHSIGQIFFEMPYSNIIKSVRLLVSNGTAHTPAWYPVSFVGSIGIVDTQQWASGYIRNDGIPGDRRSFNVTIENWSHDWDRKCQLEVRFTKGRYQRI